MDLQSHPQNRYHQRPRLPISRPFHHRQRLHTSQVSQRPGQRQGLFARGSGFQLQEVAGRSSDEAHGQS